MNQTTTNFKVIFPFFTIIFLGIAIMSCSSSEYICFKVKKSELMPDSLELGMDSLLVGGLKIATMAQRYYNKPLTIGGGGNSFKGFTIPVHLISTEFGTYTTDITPSIITVIGVRNHWPIIAVFTISPDSIVTTIE